MFDFSQFDLEKYDEIVSRGLSYGLGSRDGTMCIEAAICTALNLPHGDDPQCVAQSVRRFKIALNDKEWSSQQSRAAGLRDLGIAQLGSKGVVDDQEFLKLLSEKIIKRLIPDLFRKVANGNQEILDAADRCEREGTKAAAADAADAADAAYTASAGYAASAAAYAAHAADYAADYAAAAASAAASDYANKGDYYLILAANLALETLRDLNSPGVTLLD